MKKILLLGVILMGLAVYGSVQTVNYLSGPAFCAGCHENSYLNITPSRNSILPLHTNNSISCLLCHSAPGTQAHIDALKTVSEAEIVKEVNPLLNRLFQTNSSFNDNFNVSRFAGFRANCTKCHPDSALKGEMHANITECGLCHFAHKRKNVNFNAAGISTHKNLKCTACHGNENEMQIPSCIRCHEPHIIGEDKDRDNAACLGCHTDPHVPTRAITFIESTPKEWCSGCHTSEYQNLTLNGGKHNLLPSCVSCHPSHGYKKSCFECHGLIRGDSNKHFPHRGNSCNLCHLRKSRGGPEMHCYTCHDPHNPFSGLPRPATNQQIGEIAKQRVQNLT